MVTDISNTLVCYQEALSQCLIVIGLHGNMATEIYTSCRMMYYSKVIWGSLYLRSLTTYCLFISLSGTKYTSELQLSHPLWGESIGDRWIPLTKGPVLRKALPCHDVFMHYPSIAHIQQFKGMVCRFINSLRTKFFRGNIKMYLYFMSFLHTDMP